MSMNGDPPILPFHSFNAHECPKCAVHVYGKWRVSYDAWPHWPTGYTPPWPIPRMSHLDVSCPNCGYSVMTETADARSEPNP
jgi:predicted nucleic-acid-binding Zn-ribbon protein